ncbi:MAG: MarR family transcriptional regulator [Candidatus Acidiferrum sp.]
MLTIVVYTTNIPSVSRKAKPATLLSPAEERLFLAILKTADVLGQEAEQLTKSTGLTPTQYNVLRILRGAGPDGLPCRGIGERMISRDPDMTRLLDRMEKGGLITRARQKDDRRVVKTQITEAGLNLLQKLDQPMRDLHKKQFQHMAAAQLKILGDLLDACRNRAPD